MNITLTIIAIVQTVNDLCITLVILLYLSIQNLNKIFVHSNRIITISNIMSTYILLVIAVNLFLFPLSILLPASWLL